VRAEPGRKARIGCFWVDSCSDFVGCNLVHNSTDNQSLDWRLYNYLAIAEAGSIFVEAGFVALDCKRIGAHWVNNFTAFDL
jgi:hypothetical protein